MTSGGAADFAATERMSLLRATRDVRKSHDGGAVEAIAEIWAEAHLGMIKSPRGAAGLDGHLPDGRSVQVKSKKYGAHSDSGTCITVSDATVALAEDMLIIFVDYETLQVRRVIGPFPTTDLKPRGAGRRCHINDSVKAGAQDRAWPDGS